MKKSQKTIEMERRLIASLSTEVERAEMRALLDVLWEQQIEIARLKIERDKAINEYHDATRALFAKPRKGKK